MSRKPIRVFYSSLTGRFWASQYYKELPGGIVQITGAKYDVTSDIGQAVNRYSLEFTPNDTSDPHPDGPSTGIAHTAATPGQAAAGPNPLRLPVAAPAVSGAIPEGPGGRGQSRKATT